MNEWNLCEFIFAPWKVQPASSKVLGPKRIAQITNFYFTDINNINNNDEEYIDHYRLRNFDKFDYFGQSDNYVSVELNVNANEGDGEMGNINVNTFEIQRAESESSIIKRQDSDKSYLSKHTHFRNFDLKFKPIYNVQTTKPNMMKSKVPSVSTHSTKSATNSPYSTYSTFSAHSPSLNGIDGISTPHTLLQQHAKYKTQEIDANKNPNTADKGSPSFNGSAVSTKRESILLVDNFSLNADLTEDEIIYSQSQTHKITDTMMVVPEQTQLQTPQFIDVANNVPHIPNDISIVYEDEVHLTVYLYITVFYIFRKKHNCDLYLLHKHRKQSKAKKWREKKRQRIQMLFHQHLSETD